MNGQPSAAHWRVLSRGKLVRGSTLAIYYRALTGTAYCQTLNITEWRERNLVTLTLPSFVLNQTEGDMKHYASTESIQRCRPVGSNFLLVRPVAKAALTQKKISPSFFIVVWIGSHSTFVLCTALLTAEYTEGDRAQSEGQHPQAL